MWIVFSSARAGGKILVMHTKHARLLSSQALNSVPSNRCNWLHLILTCNMFNTYWECSFLRPFTPKNVEANNQFCAATSHEHHFGKRDSDLLSAQLIRSTTTVSLHYLFFVNFDTG